MEQNNEIIDNDNLSLINEYLKVDISLPEKKYGIFFLFLLIIIVALAIVATGMTLILLWT